ncbi:MAG TPA: prepilin-type N-terminal cleavage/methylation domain-containing protein [Tepidisphaeraceae bacterium]|nr:prepilin-type N-terminal cleavage/methylation domain-containing protein [Tepidisphaeraceae bacterium]
MSRPKAFTLVELLVVLALLTLLIAILLPALKAARRSAERVLCTANMKQIGQAFLYYAHDNQGWLPNVASYWAWMPTAGWTYNDWIHWQAGRDITRSALWPYLGSSKLLVCPAGIPDRAPEYLYPFSYSLNGHLPWYNLKRVVQPWHKAMLVEEDSLTINDGEWQGGVAVPRNGNPTGLLSVRHDLKSEYGGLDVLSGKNVQEAMKLGRGHVICADGSFAVVRRWEIYSSYWTLPEVVGDPAPPIPK